ncbi:unnamed protein product, partial [Laminaria digitata]
GTQGARVHTRVKFGPRRRAVAQALVAQSRAALVLCPGMHAEQSRPTRVLEPRIFVLFDVFLFFFLLAVTAAVHSSTTATRVQQLLASRCYRNLLLYHTPPPSISLLVAVTVQQQPRFKP